MFGACRNSYHHAIIVIQHISVITYIAVTAITCISCITHRSTCGRYYFTMIMMSCRHCQNSLTNFTYLRFRTGRSFSRSVSGSRISFYHFFIAPVILAMVFGDAFARAGRTCNDMSFIPVMSSWICIV